jgi:SGS domain
VVLDGDHIHGGTMKSYREYKGKAPSTNWPRIRSKGMEPHPPDGTEAGKWGEQQMAEIRLPKEPNYCVRNVQALRKVTEEPYNIGSDDKLSL